jgi:hypothetical protein
MKIILCYAVRLGPGRGSDLAKDDSIRVENKSNLLLASMARKTSWCSAV